MALPDNFPALPDFPPGEVWLAGAGPGDPALLTVLALHALSLADDVVHDALVDPRVLQLARAGAELVPAGKRGGRPSPRQRDINQALIERARQGRRVLRLKGGDPFVFGRGWEEAAALTSAGIRFRIVPGITAGLAAAALAGIPATSRDTNHAVILAAGHRAEDNRLDAHRSGADQSGADRSGADWEALAKIGQPIVLYMPMSQLEEVSAALQRGGMAGDTLAALIQSASTPEERVVESTLSRLVADAKTSGIGSPAILVIGSIVGLRQGLLGGMVGWR
jgi:uroporphyrin-III C-methyltransferase